MAYDENLAKRIRANLGKIQFVEKKMFGGIGFLIHGNMACGVYKNDLIVRVPADKNDNFLKKTGAKPMDITGRPMKGWLLVEPVGCKTARQLNTWIKEGVEYALTLPRK